MDFTFGHLISDDLKLTSHRAERHGVQHLHNISPLDPEPDESVTVTVVTDSSIQVSHVALYYTTDGSQPQGSRGQAISGRVVHFDQVESRWDTLLWDYLTRWQAIIPGQPNDTVVSYLVSAWTDGGDEIFSDWPDARQIIEHATSVFFNNAALIPDFQPGDPSRGHVFSYQVDTLDSPDWAQDAVIYHIFVDRFFPGEGKSWLQTENLEGFCGGTLWGVQEKLDYIEQLGIDCIWLSPTWASPTHHGYDVTDYDHVEPRLGGDEALHALVEAAHQRGIRVLLDLACNHISNRHPMFQDALNNPESSCRHRFIFDDSTNSYKSYFGVPTMPELNLTHPETRTWMIGVACRWLRDFDIDGYRLDYASGPGPDFWSFFRAACKQMKPDCLLFGEVIDVPSKIARYQGRLDGCLDFQMNDALRRTFGWKSWSEKRLNAFLERHYGYFPDRFVMPTFLDNHDMDRFSYIVDNDLVALKKAAETQIRLPGPPVIFYGTEVGVRQRKSTRSGGLHLSREPMVWGSEQDVDLLTFYKQIIRQRRQRKR